MNNDCTYMLDYGFNASAAFDNIKNHWTEWAKSVNATKFIVGISGGIDSTCVAALACKIFGKENVYGISMPNDVQHDIVDVLYVFDCLGIKKLDFNIGDINKDILNGIENNAIDVTELTKTNLPPRLRMAVVYAFAQSLNAFVLNTCNLSESLMCYDTLYGDDCGSYAPIQKLTKTEVRKLAEWLGVPIDLVNKTPIDGLQANSDEEAFGFSYYELDKYIRTNNCGLGVMAKILERYNKGKWKRDIIHIVGPTFDFPDYIQNINI